LNLNAHIKKEA